MLRLLLLSAIRFHVRQPWQLGLALAGIGLGVAAFIGIQSANRAAERAFELSAGAMRGAVTHRLIPIGGDLPDSIYTDLVRRGYGDRAAPIIAVQARIVADGRPATRVDLFGIDPIEEIRLQRFVPAAGDPAARLLQLIAEPRTALATADLLASGSDDGTIDLEINGQSVAFDVIGELAAVALSGTSPTLVTDISTLQPMVGAQRISRIDLRLDDAGAADLRAALPAGTALVDATNRDSDLEGMTRAFTTNLTALGLLALVVGLFLIHATMSFSVVRRRAQIATLRALGLSRRELSAAIALEAALIGALAGLGGAALGQLLADALVDLVLRTMNDLAFSRALAGDTTPWWNLPAGLLIGIVTTLVAGVLPAREAAALAPAAAERRSDLEAGTRRLGRRLAVGSVPVIMAAAAIVLVSPQALVAGFVALFLILVAGAMCVPAATVGLMRVAESPARALAGLSGIMAVRSVTASLSRTGVATAALAVAVATVMSIGLMVGSFRDSLTAWIDETLTADFYLLIDAAGENSGRADSWADAISALPGVLGISRTLRTVVPAAGGDVGLRASTPGPEGWGLDLVGEAAPGWADALGEGAGIIVTEPYAYRHELAVGDPILLPTATTEKPFRILGVAREYNTAGSAVVMSLSRYRADWLDESLSGIGVHLQPGTDRNEIAAAIDALRPAGIEAALRSTDAIRRISLTLFDRTFEITAVLRALAGIVAFFGVLSAVLALQLDRQQEFSILRSLGMSLGRLRLDVVIQTALLGCAAALAAIPIGCALAWLLVFVINRRAFGWTMDFAISAPPIAYGIAVALAAATLSGMAAAWLGLRPDSDGAAHAG